jgi:hypothetical protein
MLRLSLKSNLRQAEKPAVFIHPAEEHGVQPCVLREVFRTYKS